jgi:hypothetical protein
MHDTTQQSALPAARALALVLLLFLQEVQRLLPPAAVP